jgi:hypothetical protein
LSAKRNVAEGERVSDRLAGETSISSQGLPEEAPPGADPGGGGGSKPREAANPPRKHDDRADEQDDGKATGNPRNAG